MRPPKCLLHIAFGTLIALLSVSLSALSADAQVTADTEGSLGSKKTGTQGRDNRQKVVKSGKGATTHSVTVGIRQISGWERSVMKREKNLRHWTWLSVPEYHRSTVKIVGDDIRHPHGVRKKQPPRYVKPVHVALPNRNMTTQEYQQRLAKHRPPAYVKYQHVPTGAINGTLISQDLSGKVGRYVKPIHVPLPANNQLPSVNGKLSSPNVDAKLANTEAGGRLEHSDVAGKLAAHDARGKLHDSDKSQLASADKANEPEVLTYGNVYGQIYTSDCSGRLTHRSLRGNILPKSWH